MKLLLASTGLMDETHATESNEFHLDPVTLRAQQGQVRRGIRETSEINQDEKPSSRTSFSSTREESSNGKETSIGRSPTSNTSKSSGSDGANRVDAPHDIVWLYLTFDTTLPHGTGLTESPVDETHAQLDVPNLTPFINPMEWSKQRKWTLIGLSCASTILCAYASGCYTPAIDLMAAEWHVSNVAMLVGITVFTVGFGVAPMFLAPFSELVGRRPIFLSMGFLFLIFDICCAATRLYVGMIVARFLAGCASSTFATMVGGVVSDIYGSADRNTPMTLFTASALIGTGIGPVISGYLLMGTNGNWRWIFWLHSILVAVLVVAMFFFFEETRGTVLLSRKAKKLNEWYEQRENSGHWGFQMPVEGSAKKQVQRIRWKVKADEDRTSIGQMIKISLVRPFHLLFTEPVVFFFALWASFAWAILYCQFGIIPFTFETVYHFPLQDASAVFSVLVVGSLFAIAVSIAQDKWARRGGRKDLDAETRLIFPCTGGLALPVALFWFGWTVRSSIPWIVPVIAVGFATFGIFSIYLAGFNYLADTYHIYASSAIAAQSFCRNLMAGAFPLFTEQMFEKLGFGGAGSLLGGIGVAVSIVPWVLLFYGPKIRARSKFASEMVP